MSAANKFGRLKDARLATEQSAVRVTTFNDLALPLVYEASEDADLVEWVRLNQHDLRDKLYRHGALLLRSPSKPDFASVVGAFTDRLVDYKGGAAIRSRVNSDTYTASEYPEELEIRLHSEFCYSNDWPMILVFYCDVAPRDRGQTPIADNHRILAQMPSDIRDQFAARGLTYMRGYGYTARGSGRTRPTVARRSKLCAPWRADDVSGLGRTSCGRMKPVLRSHAIQ